MTLDDDDQTLLRRLAALLRLADGLDAYHFQVVEQAAVVQSDGYLRLELRARDAPSWTAGGRTQWRSVRVGVRPRVEPVARALGRLQEAAAAWQYIIDWCDAHDAPLTAEWPKRELARLRTRRSDG